MNRRSAWALSVAALASTLACGTPTAAQIGPLGAPRLPGLPSGLMDRVPDLDRVDRLADGALDRALRAPARLTALVRRSGGALDVDPLGWPVVAGEIIAVDLSDEARAIALEAGYRILREERLEALDLQMIVLAPPRRLSLPRAVERLRTLDPAAEITFNHIHAPAGDAGPDVSSATAQSKPSANGARLGLIDTGVDAAHSALAGSRISQRGFAGAPQIGAHGSAVASLMVGRSGAFSGGAPGADLLVADIYGGNPAGGSATALAQALNWMVEQGVAVVNVSLVGPRNGLVERAVVQAQRRGVIVVAAVGNEGPAAAPLYPAAYSGVVGVTGVSVRDQVLPEAARGAHVDFAAPGADMAAAASGGGWTSVRGTSFAAPIVAGLIATRGQAALSDEATDLGDRGRDPIYGSGLIGTGSRVAPSSVGARGRLRR